jgi:hypothetical protein
MGGPVILTPGQSSFAFDAAGATLRLMPDGTLWRNGVRYVIAGVALAAAKIGIYGQNLFATAHDGTLWLAAPWGWQNVTSPDPAKPIVARLVDVDADFVAAMSLGATNEPT